MESYHSLNSLSSGAYPDMPVRNTTAPRKLLPFEYVATPPITHLLMAILGYCRVGGSFAPGVRQLSEMSGVTLSTISGLLYELDREGWIQYDGHVIMVLRDLNESDDESDQLNRDQLIADQLIADSLISDDESPSSALGTGDQNPDRSDRHMVDSCLATALDSESAARSKIPCAAKNDQRADHPAGLVLAELGTNATLRARALEIRPDLTPQQVRDTWAHFEQRIAAGRCTPAAFHAAIAQGEIHPAPPDPARPLDPASYARDPAYQLGSQAEPDEAARRNALYRDAHWRAVDLLGPGAAYQDMAIVVEALVDGATDDQALAELARELSEAQR